MSDVVPFEVQMEIVKRVDDVSSLIRFRSVSKEWKLFIDSREFIAGYGFRHTQPSRFMLRYLHYLLDEFGELISTGLIWFSELERYICFVDNDDGFALQHDFPPFVVVPDLIQQLKRDDSSCILVPDHVPHSTIDFDNFGFGVCPVTCDPTIIKISYPAQSITWQVEIFTLSSKRWNAIIPSSNLPRKSIKLDLQTQVVIDRFIYWQTQDFYAESDRDQNIMSFDLITK
ncbi:putative F-box protein [Tanacetum coccineum]